MRVRKLLFIVLISTVCTVGAHAQKQLKYLPQTLKGAKKIPYAVNPKLPPAVRANFAMPIVRLNVSTAVERQVTQATFKAPIAAQLPAQFKKLAFLTGPQTLQAWRPGWKSELMLCGFTRQQLDLVEQTFKKTDQFLFETDETGRWLSPRSAEWNYTARFTKILTDNAWGEMALNDGQIKTLFGKFSRLDDVFTQLSLQSFLFTHGGRAPKASAPGEEGKLARKAKYNLDKRDGRKMNPEVEEYVYGKMPAKLQTPKPSYGPKIISARRTPEEVLEQVKQFIKEKGYFPGKNAQENEERSLRMAFENKIRRAKYLNDPTIMRLTALKDQWIKEKTNARTPEQVLAQVEQFMQENHRFPQRFGNQAEISLRGAFNHALKYAKDSNNSVIVRLTALKEQWVQNRAENKPPQQVLEEVEQFIEQKGHFPSESAKNVAERLLRSAFDRAIRRAKNLNGSITLQLTALKEQWVQNRAENKTPQQILEEVEQFIEENGHFPVETHKSSVERSLRRIIDSALNRAKDLSDPAIRRLTALKNQWGKKYTVRRTPQEWLEVLEPWVMQHQRWPSYAMAEERAIYNGVSKAIHRNPNDPASMRLKELKTKYGKK